MADVELVRTLQSLACGKFRILTKNPKGKDVNPSDTFSFNDGFTCPLTKIKIMQVASKVESSKEREETQDQVDEERKHMVEVSAGVLHGMVQTDGLAGVHCSRDEESQDYES